MPHGVAIEATSGDALTHKSLKDALVEAQRVASSKNDALHVHASLHGGTDFVQTFLSNVTPDQIRSLTWTPKWDAGVVAIAVLLIEHSVVATTDLTISFGIGKGTFMLMFYMSEVNNNKKVLRLPYDFEKRVDTQPIFDALVRCQVRALDIQHSRASGGLPVSLFDYLSKDLLVKFRMDMGIADTYQRLADTLSMCNNLDNLELRNFNVRIGTRFPPNITKLSLSRCSLSASGHGDWPTMPKLRELQLAMVSDHSDGHFLSKTPNLDSLSLDFPAYNVDNVVSKIDLSRIQHLHLDTFYATEVTAKTLATAVAVGVMKELHVRSTRTDMQGLAQHLASALRRPDCALTEFSMVGNYEQGVVVTEAFYVRLRLFATLEGRRRRCNSALRKLPVELFRELGKMLI